MNRESIKKLVLAAMFVSIGFVLPFLTGQIPQIGSMLLPMHIPVLLCGLICGWKYGAVVGFVLPLLRSAVFGMPPMFPVGVAMAFELATYGLVVGLLYGRSRWQCVVSLYRSMIIASGCVKSKLQGGPWTNWYKLPFIQYGPVTATVPEEVPPEEQVTVPESTRTLSYRAGATMLRGEDVRAVQTYLAALGYAVGSLDGIFGPKTDAAVRAFQRDYALEVYGVVDDSVRAALQKAVETPKNEHPESPQEAGGEEALQVNIRIQMTRSANVAIYGAAEVQMDIEEYLRGVVPSEMYESADLEALKAQAICARTYAYRRRNTLLTDTSSHQAFQAGKIGSSPRSDEALRATKGQVLTHEGKVIDCFYSASNKGITKRSGDVWSKHYPYYVSKDDEWDEAARSERNITASGHGIGMSQHGAMWAARKGVGCKSILAFYYEGAVITDNFNT